MAGILDSVPAQIPKMWLWLTVWIIGILIPLLVGAYRNSSYGSNIEDLFSQVLVDREILRAGVLILQKDDLTDQEIATLNTMSLGMDEDVLTLSVEKRKKIVDCAFSIACADKNFRVGEQAALKEIIAKYKLNDDPEIKNKFESLVTAYPATAIKK